MFTKEERSGFKYWFAHWCLSGIVHDPNCPVNKINRYVREG